MKHGGGSLMIYGCITANRAECIKRTYERINNSIYKEILEEKLGQTIECYHLNQ